MFMYSSILYIHSIFPLIIVSLTQFKNFNLDKTVPVHFLACCVKCLYFSSHFHSSKRTFLWAWGTSCANLRLCSHKQSGSLLCLWTRPCCCCLQWTREVRRVQRHTYIFMQMLLSTIIWLEWNDPLMPLLMSANFVFAIIMTSLDRIHTLDILHSDQEQDIQSRNHSSQMLTQADAHGFWLKVLL